MWLQEKTTGRLYLVTNNDRRVRSNQYMKVPEERVQRLQAALVENSSSRKLDKES